MGGRSPATVRTIAFIKIDASGMNRGDQAIAESDQ